MPAASVTPAILTVRTECSGGPIAQQVEASQDLHGFNRLTILIHGYNNSAVLNTIREPRSNSPDKFTGATSTSDAFVMAAKSIAKPTSAKAMLRTERTATITRKLHTAMRKRATIATLREAGACGYSTGNNHYRENKGRSRT